MPHQNHSIDIDSRFNTFKLGSFISKYLDGDFTLPEVQTFLADENYFTPELLEFKATKDFRSTNEIDVTACKMKGRR